MTPPTRLPATGDRSGAVLDRLQLMVTRKLDGLLQGDYAGLLPGPGSEAGESREYRPGDDVRRMDWPVTARTTLPHVRRTVADRELETWLAVDLSASLDFGTGRWLKRDVVVAAAAALAHLTVRGGNRIGAVIGTGASASAGNGPGSGTGSAVPARTGRWRGDPPATGPGTLLRLPARSGRKEAQGLLRTIAGTEIRPGRSDLGALVDTLNRPPRRRGVAVVISDFLAPPQQWSRPIRKLRVRHDVLAIEVVDPRELELPDVGVLPVVDPESGELHEVQTADPGLRRRYAEAAAAQRAAIATALRAAGAAHLRLRTDRDWLLDMVRFVAAQRHARTRGTTR
ncbi:Erythromycin resistance leader peptide [Micromonospora eburnea]|uniref:Erythromycin resistance leader peptide n=1 Tax=Micromonospora eburnea TaxID=227316 RepID=A0A1C6V3L8_9ACTN|nr:Erythromycin resistance leader peptide [Micromonospora eburnea]